MNDIEKKYNIRTPFTKKNINSYITTNIKKKPHTIAFKV